MILTDKECLIAANYNCAIGTVRAIEAAILKKLNSAEPTAWVYINNEGECEQIDFGAESPLPGDEGFVPLYLHHAPIPEGLLDLLAIIHRDGGHYTDEHGIDKAINDAKDKVWAMLAAARSGE